MLICEVMFKKTFEVKIKQQGTDWNMKRTIKAVSIIQIDNIFKNIEIHNS